MKMNVHIIVRRLYYYNYYYVYSYTQYRNNNKPYTKTPTISSVCKLQCGECSNDVGVNCAKDIQLWLS